MSCIARCSKSVHSSSEQCLFVHSRSQDCRPKMSSVIAKVWHDEFG